MSVRLQMPPSYARAGRRLESAILRERELDRHSAHRLVHACITLLSARPRSISRRAQRQPDATFVAFAAELVVASVVDVVIDNCVA